MKKLTILVGLAMAVVAVTLLLPRPGPAESASPGPNLAVNGSFEQPDIPTGGFGLFSSIPGWTLFTGPSIELQDNAAGSPFLGGQFVELDSTAPSGISQDVPTTPGCLYDLSFAFSPRPGQALTENVLRVTWDGTEVPTLTPDGVGKSDTNWTVHTFNVAPGAGNTTTLEFEDQGAPNGAGTYLDAVSVVEVCDEQININVVDKLSGAKLEGTCWRISYGPAKVAHDVVGDDVAGVKPDCGEPSNQKLSDKDPSAGNLRITITSAQRKQFGDIWHAQMSFEPKGNLDTVNYECDLSKGKCEIGPVSVGGLAVDLNPLAESGGNAGLLAGLIAGVTALAVTLTGAAWYARRRWAN